MIIRDRGERAALHVHWLWNVLLTVLNMYLILYKIYVTHINIWFVNVCLSLFRIQRFTIDVKTFCSAHDKACSNLYFSYLFILINPFYIILSHYFSVCKSKKCDNIWSSWPLLIFAKGTQTRNYFHLCKLCLFCVKTAHFKIKVLIYLFNLKQPKAEIVQNINS